MQPLSSLVCLLWLLAPASACFIQNCPKGGKRSSHGTDIRECIPCGPGKKGHCFGSNICCGQEIGCYIGTSETLICKEEDKLSSPCEPAGKSCGESDGKCATSGICCTNESCTTDPACLENAGKSRRSSLGRNLSMFDNDAVDHLVRLLGPYPWKPAGKQQLI
ncbi:neurophysin 1-like [Pristis pectinata]|uniref:neurophysin 1-like n=1 Tax=Pristis pectinata TaxID=685728 RepID=UPI00223E4715|nr:neurophysin 1-like [Pristis pectinata]